LELEFSLPVFWNNTETKYRYKLLGFNPNWVDLEGVNGLKFNQLRAGSYTLLIQGADPRGNWSQSLRLQIQVYTYFYNYWWFWALMALGIGLAVYYLVRARLLEELRMEQLRTKLSTDIHDEVSGLLAGIAMQADVLQRTNAQQAMDWKKLEKIGEIARKAMSRLRDVIWSIDARKDRLEDLIARMHDHANDVLSPLNVQYQIQVQNLEPNLKIPIQLRQDLFYIFKEALNNVAKHAQASAVEVQLKHKGRFFEMEIKDNGQASFDEKARQGNGLQNMKMRAERIQAELSFVSEQGLKVLLRRRRL
jgi:signal transduction histidine kinase